MAIGRKFIYLAENDKEINSLPTGNKEELFDFFYTRGFSYDPYSKLFKNPLIETHGSCSSKLASTMDISSLKLIISNIIGTRSKEEIEIKYLIQKDKFEQKAQLFSKINFFINLFRFIAIPLAVLVYFISNVHIGLFVLSILYYLCFNHIDVANSTKAKHEGQFDCSHFWRKHKTKIALFSYFSFAISTYLLYIILDNIWFSILIMFMTRLFLETYVFFELQSIYWYKTGFLEVDDYLDAFKAR